jgi:outer membrane protein assembly factor BamB
MNRYDRSATGANTSETILNTHSVNATGFGKLYSYYVDGAVYGQPLYVHNVLYVATMNDKVYAFDAEKSGPPLWMRNFTDEMAGVTPVPVADITNRNDLNVVGNAGIESTPVIDAAAGAIYVLARTKRTERISRGCTSSISKAAKSWFLLSRYKRMCRESLSIPGLAISARHSLWFRAIS